MTLHTRLAERATGLLTPLGGQIIVSGDRIHLPLPRAGRWIELTPVWLEGRGPGWEGRDWPGGERVVGGEWEVMTWVIGRLHGAQAALFGARQQQTTTTI